MSTGPDPLHDEWAEMDGNGDDVSRFKLAPKVTRAQMLHDEIEFICPRARFLARGVKQDITSLGGAGKTRLALQVCAQLERGEALFGCELLRPKRPMRCLYIGAEDRQRFFNYVAAPLLERDEDTLPFDVVLLPEVWPGFTLSPSTAKTLARFLAEYGEEHGLDVVVLDPMLSVIGREYADLVANPIVARAFFNDCIQPLLESQTFALLGLNHDSKSGAAVTGSADQQNASRCVLQLSTDGPRADGSTVVAVDRHKDNLGFRFTKLALIRDAKTLLYTFDEAGGEYAYGAPGERKNDRPSQDPADVRRYLSRQAARLLAPTLAPEERRATKAVEDLLCAQASKDGIPKVKDAVRSFLRGCGEFEPRKAGRVTRLVLVGVRNPDAALDEHADFIAGRAAEVSE